MVSYGWTKLANFFIDKINEYNNIYPEKQITLIGLNNKYNDLRYIFNPSNDKNIIMLHKFINRKSKTICELCGRNGIIDKRTDIFDVRCPKHMNTDCIDDDDINYMNNMIITYTPFERYKKLYY
jgi:hypothetical protein